jgi:type IV secretion system protein VirD4
MAFPFRRKETVIGSDAPDAFGLGRYRDELTGRIGPKLQIPGTEPIVIVGRNRSGKDAGIGTSNLLRLMGTSCFWVDPRAEAAAIAGPYRRTLGPTYNLNAFGLLTKELPDLVSDGVSTVAGLTHIDSLLFDKCMAVSEAIIKTDDKNPHFTARARELFAGLLMVEVLLAAQSGRKPLLANVRAMLTEPEVRDPVTKEPIAGLAATAIRWSKAGNPQIASLLASFTSLDSNEVRDVIATADAATLCLLSQPIRDDELKAGFDFNELGERPTTVFLSAPHELFQADSIHAPYMRLILSSGLRSLYRPTKTSCIFYINELASFGRLSAIESSIGLTAGYGIRIVLVVQSLSQLRQLYQHGWENFLGNAAAIALVGPPADAFTADYLSKRSGDKTIIQPNAGINLNPQGVGLQNGQGYTRRPYLMAADLYGLPPGWGFVWVAGLSGPIPTYYPPYWDVDQLNRRARANPYYKG